MCVYVSSPSPVPRIGCFSTFHCFEPRTVRCPLVVEPQASRFQDCPFSLCLSSYYQRTKIQPAAGDGPSSTKDVPPENFKSSRPPGTALPVLKVYTKERRIQPAAGDGRSSTKMYYQRTKILTAAGDGSSSTRAVLPENKTSRP